MKSFLVVGLGRFGGALAMELYRMGHEVFAIDRDEEKVNKIADFVTHAMTADPTNEQVLAALGARNFDHGVIAFSNNLQDNILITLQLKEMGVSAVTAKARDRLHKNVLEKIGADRIVLPEYEMGIRTARLLAAHNLNDLIEVSDDYSIAELKAPTAWVGQSIRGLDIRAKFGINVMMVKQSDHNALPSPGPTYVIKKGDVLVVMGTDKDVHKVGAL